jgi:hypothetical protein
MKLSPSEKYIQQLFFTRFGITLSKIDELGGNEGQTSDFEYCIERQRIFVCELKDFEDVPSSKKHGWAIINHPNGNVEAFGKDNAVDRISRHIYKAYKQLSKYLEPKILIFLNHTPSLNVGDFEETFQGRRIMAEENGIRYINVFAKRVADGEIKDIKKKIDLYIWVDSAFRRTAFKEDKVYFRTITEAGRKIAKDYFGRLNTLLTD